MAQAKAAKAHVESESRNADGVVKAKLELALTPRYAQKISEGVCKLTLRFRR